MLARDARQIFDGIEDAGRCLRLHERDEVGALLPECVAQPFRVARTAPLHLHAPDARPVTLAHLGETIAEIACDDDDGAHALNDRVRERRLEGGRAGAGDRDCKRVGIGAEEPLQAGAHLVHQRNEFRIEMAQHRRRHRADDPRRHLAWSGAQKNAFGRG